MEQIGICDAVHNGWSSLHHVIDGYDEATEKAMPDYDIHRTKMKLYYIAKALHHRLDSYPPTVYNAPDKLDRWEYCRATVKNTKVNRKYEAKNMIQ